MNEKEKEKEKKAGEFMSTILSTVLKHHLSWVYTVQPTTTATGLNSVNSVSSSDSGLTTATNQTCSQLRKQRADWTRLLEKLNPYNPLWAQLGDLHGAVNHPYKLVRTVVVGQNQPFVNNILFVLSYFIRCGNSSYFDIVEEKFDFDKIIRNNNLTRPQTTTTTTAENHFDINVSELKYDPLAQFNSFILNATTSPGLDKPKHQHTTSRSSTSSSSSSSTSPSSSSASSSSIQSPFASDLTKINSIRNKNNNIERRLSSNSIGSNSSAHEFATNRVNNR